MTNESDHGPRSVDESDASYESPFLGNPLAR